MNDPDRFQGCLLGLAAGDAVGTTVEFKPRGPFRLPPGAWTDDTSMALCLAESLVEKGGFDARDQMERYLRWYREGYLSSTGVCFDIGNTVRAALHRFEATGAPFSGATDPYSAGNGSIMRLAPIPLFFYPDQDKIWRYAAESSRTTHGALEGLDACRLLGDMLFRALGGAAKEAILLGTDPARLEAPKIQALARGGYRAKKRDAIKGGGYVVESLEAALWCFWQTDNFRDAILLAANLGDDADTTAAICGQAAGALYGVGGIPAEWLVKLVMRMEIEALASALHHPYST